MPVVQTDVLLHTFGGTRPDLIGQRSVYAQVPHPGTNKVIDGWKWDQRTWPDSREFEASEFAPSIWDPSTSGIDDALFQSGCGDNNDILLLDVDEVATSGIDVWAPKINHGYFYIRDEEWFLYSDAYQTQYFTVTGVEDSKQYVNLTHDYKPTIPIQVRRYSFDALEGRYHVDKEFRKKVEFSEDPDGPEFIVDTDFSPPRIVLDGEYNEAVGVPVTVSGDLLALELLGTSDGSPDQEFQVQFHPIDRSQPVEIWTWKNVPSGGIQWTVITGTQEFSPGSVYEAYVDYDRGTVKFGNFNPVTLVGNGRAPSSGSNIGIHYTKGIAVHYEPKNYIDHVLATSDEADINPLSSSASSGFVQVTTEIVEPASISLTADLPQINPFLIELGNNVGELIATVRSKAGELLEGQKVTFEILPPQFGTFGAAATSVSAVTGADGAARTFFNSPLTASEAGAATLDVEHQGPDTVVTAAGLIDPGDLNRLFLYKIHINDEVLGIPASGLDDYYTNYLSEELIVEDPDGTPATQAYEEEYRTINELPKPTTYPVDDIETGKRTIILTIKSAGGNVIDPNTGDEDNNDPPLDVLSAIFPSNVENIGSDNEPVLEITYSNVLLTLPGNSDTKSYFVVGDVQTRCRAFVVHPRTGKRIFSNIIELRITIPDSLSGTYFVDDLNALPSSIKQGLLRKPRNINDIPDANIAATQAIESFNQDYLDERLSPDESYVEWFRRTRKADTAGLIAADIALENDPEELSPEQIEIIANGEIPLGFRLKSTGVSIASILDQVTFLHPNTDLPDGYYAVESTVGFDSLGHQFQVT